MRIPVAVVPPVPALLPAYAGLSDPVADVRSAARGAVEWLVARSPAYVALLGDPLSEVDLARGVTSALSERVGRHLLDEAGFEGEVVTGPHAGAGWLVLANGSARRGEKAPGHLDERARDFDAQVESALAGGDLAPLSAVDPALGADLLAAGTRALTTVGELGDVEEVVLRYAEDPYGVRYWVATWTATHRG